MNVSNCDQCIHEEICKNKDEYIHYCNRFSGLIEEGDYHIPEFTCKHFFFNKKVIPRGFSLDGT